MSVYVRVGDVFDRSEVRSGDSNRGPWALVRATANEGKDVVTIFASNPAEVKAMTGAVKIKSIEKVSKKAKKDKDTGAWSVDYSLEATFEQSTEGTEQSRQSGFDAFQNALSGYSAKDEGGFMQIPADIPDGQLPFR